MNAAARIEHLYAEHESDIRRFLLGMLRDPEDVEDALQSTMLKALVVLAGEPPRSPRAWLLRIAHNEAIDTLRLRRDHSPIEDAEGVGTPSAEEHAAWRTQLAEALGDVRDLPERQRSALLLREMSGLGYREIASILDMSAANARRAVHEARRGIGLRREARDTPCEVIQFGLARIDGRTRRSVLFRAHVRECCACQEFAAGIARTPRALLQFPLSGVLAWLRGLAVGGSGAVKAAVTLVAVVVAAGTAGIGHKLDDGDENSRPRATQPNAAAIAFVRPHDRSSGVRRDRSRKRRSRRSERSTIESVHPRVPARVAPSHGTTPPSSAGTPAPAGAAEETHAIVIGESQDDPQELPTVGEPQPDPQELPTAGEPQKNPRQLPTIGESHDDEPPE